MLEYERIVSPRHAFPIALCMCAGSLSPTLRSDASVVDHSSNRPNTIRINIDNAMGRLKKLSVELTCGGLMYLKANSDPTGTSERFVVGFAAFSDSAGLGTYDTVLDMNHRKHRPDCLSIRPLDDLPVHLAGLFPSPTYKDETVDVPDLRDQTGVALAVSNHELGPEKDQLPGIAVHWSNAEYRPVLSAAVRFSPALHCER
jgi:hypothetical protein